MFAPFFAMQAGLMVLAALAAGPGRGRKLLLGILIALAAVTPWLAYPKPAPRMFLTFMAGLMLMKGSQIAGSAGPWPVWRRLWHLFAPFDVRDARFDRPALDLRSLFNLLLFAAIGAGAFMGLARLAALAMPGRPPLRILLGVTLTYASMEVANHSILFVHRLVGLVIPPAQVSPVLSRSVTEFWGRRWNRPVNAWLTEFVFRPFARRRHGSMGILTAFLVSGGFHGWMISASAPPASVALATGFFVVQAFIVLLERRIGVQRWPPPAARVWTLLLLLATAPLFLYPFLGLVGL